MYYYEREGSGSVYADSIKAKKLDLSLRYGGEVKIGHLECDSLDIDAYAGSVKAAGSCGFAGIRLSSPGDIDLLQLKTKRASALVKGLGVIKLFVTDSLRAVVDGEGAIFYKGDPVIEKKISGKGSLIKL